MGRSESYSHGSFHELWARRGMELAARDRPEDMAMAEERSQLRHCNSEASSSHGGGGSLSRGRTPLKVSVTRQVRVILSE